MLRTVRSASELAIAINRLTNRFPEEERYVLVQTLREIGLTVLENTAIGMARLDHGYRYIALANAVSSLKDLKSKFTLCKQIAVLSESDISDLKLKCDVLQHQLQVAIKNTEHIPVEPIKRFE